MSGHPNREPSAKNSVSLANLRHTPSQNEVSPRKAVSHEGLQKSTSTSNASSTGSNNSGGHAGTTNTDTNSPSSGAVSAFSYLKARLFGSVADASTSLTSSARDLLQSKKSSESTKSNQGGDEFTHRLLFLPPSQEVRHQWYTKFNRAKELQQSKPDFRGRGKRRVTRN
ncbi:hypothetical protein BGZ74_003312 [Mortierella antarctica]|nr:hypothetical protein BGZ74_003312 [Mortierella antarctica]